MKDNCGSEFFVPGLSWKSLSMEAFSCTKIVSVFIKQPNYMQVAENCNLWRSWWDMDVSTMLLVFSLQVSSQQGLFCINLSLKHHNSYGETKNALQQINFMMQ